jgi:hypothetical protein
MIGAFIIAKNATCKVKINKRCVKGTCELYNGVFFEKLTVIKKDSIGMPAEYIVTERFECYNPGVGGNQKYWPRKIFFNKANGHYKWRADTIDIHFRMNGNQRIIVSANKKPQNYHDFHILRSNQYDICPITLQKETWYNVELTDQRLRFVFLYIDSKRNYIIYKIDSGVCPI